MEIKFAKKRIELEKELNSLDYFVIELTTALNTLKIKYAIISGYTSILFGRNTSPENIDIFLEKIDYEKFTEMWNLLKDKFKYIIPDNAKEAYNEYLPKGQAIRFVGKDNAIPNIKLKFPKEELDAWTLENRKEVLLNKNPVFISPIELQIPSKLTSGSETEIEDAKYLYTVLKDKLNPALLDEFNRKLDTKKIFDKRLK